MILALKNGTQNDIQYVGKQGRESACKLAKLDFNVRQAFFDHEQTDVVAVHAAPAPAVGHR